MKLTKTEQKLMDLGYPISVSRSTGDCHYTMENGMSVKVLRRVFGGLKAKGLVERIEQTQYRNLYSFVKSQQTKDN